MARLEDKFKARASGITPGATASPLVSVPGATPDVLTQLPTAQIAPDPAQPRRDLGDLTDLKASIASVGIVQPIVVTVIDYERYQIIAGERRYSAAKELGLPRIPAIVRTLEGHERLRVQIVENLHRKDLSPVEEAQSYQRLIQEFGFIQEQVAQQVGKSRSAVNEAMRLLDLPAAILEESRTSDISKSALLLIAKRPASEQAALWEQAKAGKLTVRQARNGHAPRWKRKPATNFGSGHFRYPIQTEEAVVTVVFPRSRADLEDIIAALEQALAYEKERRR